jgi:peptidylprolyl isomerase
MKIKKQFNRFGRSCAPLLLLFLFASCVSDDRAMEEILRLEDRRAPAVELAKFVASANSAAQRRAVVALGRLQDTSAVSLLVPLLKVSEAGIRAEAAFALGQLAQPQTINTLLQHYTEEKDLEVRLALIEAVSKTANDSTMNVISDALLKWFTDQIPIGRAEAALSAARLAQRGFKKSEWSAPLANLLDDRDEEVRWRAAYALMRLYSGGQITPDSTATKNLMAALKDRSARVRMQTARAIGAMKSAAALELLTEAGKHDADWRVRVNATAALGNLDFAGLPTRFALNDTSEHVRLTVIRALGTATERMLRNNFLQETQPVKEFLRARLQDSHAAWREQAAAASALAQIFKKEAFAELARHAAHPHPIFRSRLAEAFGITAASEAFPYLEQMARDSAMNVRIAALEALPKLPAGARATPIYLKALQGGDAVITAIAAQNLATDSLRRKNHAAAIMAAYQKLKPPVDAEAAQMIFAALAQCGDLNAKPLLEEALQIPDKPVTRAAAEALKKLTGGDYSNRIPKEIKPAQDFTYKDIQNLAKASATIQTNKGNIEITFYPEAAPLTSLNFVRLAQKGYFDGLLIHRVVPNFVIQTGDPRGDGWGGPGYAIRSEFSRWRYTRGMVGMASAGTDTEGSQFFITHSEQPHLDGKYTIFARVKSGMEVVDILQVGDRMEKVAIQF